MNEVDITRAVLAALSEIAPEIEADNFDRQSKLRDEADLDSMDILNFVVALHEYFNIDIPESDYSHLVTVDTCVAYIARRLEGGK